MATHAHIYSKPLPPKMGAKCKHILDSFSFLIRNIFWILLVKTLGLYSHLGSKVGGDLTLSFFNHDAWALFVVPNSISKRSRPL